MKTMHPVASITDADRYRPREAAQLARSSIGFIYIGIKEGWFKSWTVRRRGFERGARFIDGPSFRAWLASQKEEISA
jgi:hypothetical protein